MRAFALCLLLASPAVAQELTYSDAHTQACMDEAVGYAQQLACIGASSNQCMTDTVGGHTTVGMGGCLDRELGYWDKRLNVAYGAVRAARKAADADLAAQGASAPSQADALRQMQRAWIGFRDAKCDYERSLWSGGTGGGPATLSCLMQETARQAIYLEADAGRW